MSRVPITSETGRKVVEMYRTGEFTQDQLAKHFCVSQSFVGKVVMQAGLSVGRGGRRKGQVIRFQEVSAK